MLTVQLAQDEIMIRTRSFLILVLPISLRTRFPRPDFHGQTSLIRTTIMDEHGIGFFSSIISCPLGHGSSREIWPPERSASELVPRVMVLLVGNHVDLPNRGTCHMSLIHLFVSFQMSGPIAYKYLISIATFLIFEISLFNHSRLRFSSRSILRP